MNGFDHTVLVVHIGITNLYTLQNKQLLRTSDNVLSLSRMKASV